MKHLLILTSLVLLTVSCENTSLPPEMVLVKGESFDWKKILEVGTQFEAISDFYVQKYETTRKEWEVFLDDTGRSDFRNKVNIVETPYNQIMFYPESALAGVTFLEALEYCNWRSRKDGLAPVYRIEKTLPLTSYYPTEEMPTVEIDYSATGYRLPTQAEWTYLALGGKQGIESKWWQGANAYDYGWFAENDSHTVTTQKVGQLKPNPLGLYDVFGNVEEWCWDSLGQDTSPQFVPRTLRVLMGGSVLNKKDQLQRGLLGVNYLAGMDPLYRGYIGIRMIRYK